ncbi:hypothetical protein JL722_5197 [Aureococcus anophagefferens]|nr:hypothetical protein JL722_5197 [Aureococcus anophagefferens]
MMAAPRASSAAASQKLTLGLICRTLGVEDVDAILALKALHLDGLRIDRVGNLEAFAGTLRELHLQRNRIAFVDGEALAGLAPSLAVLNLSRNGLREAPDLREFRALRVLDLSGNALEAVPVSLPGASLTVLDLRGNAFGDGVPDTDRGRVLAPAPLEARRRGRRARGGAAPGAAPGVGGGGRRAARAGPRAPGRRARVAVARDFCAAHDLDGPGAAEALLEALRDAPRRAAAPAADGKENDGLDALDPAIERAFAGLAKFEGDADGALDATRDADARLALAARWRRRRGRGPRGAAAAAATRDARDLADGYDAAPARHDVTRFDDLPDAGSDFSDSDDDVGAKGGR